MNKIKDDILSYREMCDAENIQTLQRGMNFRLNPAFYHPSGALNRHSLFYGVVLR